MNRIRRAVAALAMGAALAVPLSLSAAPPAHAATWVRTTCWSQAPWNSQVFGVPGAGAAYRNAWTPTAGYWLTGGLYQAYARQGYECGGFGLVLLAGSASTTDGLTYLYAFFVPPNSCRLLAGLQFTSGPQAGQIAWSDQPRYFC